MSLESVLNDLTAVRTRLRSVLNEKGLTANATISLNDIAALLERLPAATSKLTLTAPDDLDLYAGENSEGHFWSDADVLTVKVLCGSTVLTSRCTGYNGVTFETDELSHFCAGNRVVCEVGPRTNLDCVTLTIQWLRGQTVVRTEYRPFNWTHLPQYFRRPAGSGNYSLKIGGSAVAAEVFYNGSWIDFPNGVLSSAYAGCMIRTKAAPASDAVACWSDEGVDGDPFWYLT